jgi:hypothetical protein
MASKRRLRKSICGNKVKYENQTEAVSSLITVKRNNNIRSYKCRFCNKWHIDHWNMKRYPISGK